MLRATITIYDRNASAGRGNPVASAKRQFELVYRQKNQVHSEIQQAIDFLSKLRDEYSRGHVLADVRPPGSFVEDLRSIWTSIHALRQYYDSGDHPDVFAKLTAMLVPVERTIRACAPNVISELRNEVKNNG